jgi:hypothetical protein
MHDACQSFLIAGGTVSNTILCEAHMARGVAMISDICRQPGDGSGFGARNRHSHAITFWLNAGPNSDVRTRQLVPVFETFHKGLDHADRREATLKHFRA